MIRWLCSLFRREHGMPSLASLPLHSRLTVALIDASERRSALR